MDKIEKFLRRLPKSERFRIQKGIDGVLNGDWGGWDVKKTERAIGCLSSAGR